MKTVIVFLADGFEECEGLLIVDLLRRAKIKVITASVMGRREIVSSHGITLLADELAEDMDFESADMVVLPGGGIGTKNLAESAIVLEQCRIFAASKLLGAICAAPSILAGLGLMEGKPATCYPTFADRMQGALLTDGQVAVAGNIITGQALGAAIPFALELIRHLKDAETAETVARKICWHG